NRKIDGGRSIEPAGVPRCLYPVVDVGDLAEADRAAIAVGDRNRPVTFRVHQLAARLHDVVADGPEKGSGGPVDVGVGDRGGDLVDPDLPGRELRGIDVD